MGIDFEDEADSLAASLQTEDSLAELVRRGDELRSTMQKIEDLEEDIKLLKEAKDNLEKNRIPDLMDRMKLKEFVLEDGYKITSGPFVQASLPKDPIDREFTLTWLRDNGHEDLIKRKVEVSFDRGMDEKAQKLADFARTLGMNPEDKADIHHMTFTSFIKEQLSKGVAVPVERMGAFIGRKAKVTAPKTK